MNDYGRAQAALAGKRFHAEQAKLDAVWSSDLQRCVETAQIIVANAVSDAKEAPTIMLDEDLRERAMGELEGMAVVDATIKCEREGKTFHDYGENRKQTVRRLNRALDAIVEESLKQQYSKVLIVSHGGVIARFIHHLVTDKGFELLSDIGIEHFRVPHNTSFTSVLIDEKSQKGMVMSFGDVAHLGSVAAVDQKAL